MSQPYKSLSIANPEPRISIGEKLSIILALSGLIILFYPIFKPDQEGGIYRLIISLCLFSSGILSFSYQRFYRALPGIKNNRIWHKSLSNRGVLAWLCGLILTAFYILLYFFPEFLGQASTDQPNTGLIAVFDPLSHAIKNENASQWFVYGVLYTLMILLFGIRFLWKYRHSPYQQIRTASVMFFQTGFAFLIPELLERLNKRSYTLWFDKDLKNMWPLDYDFFFDWHMNNMLDNGFFGIIFLVFALLMIFIISPILTYKFGKRWYCSWVCGCGGLAETAGDPFRHLSDKSLRAWKIERWLIHSILGFSVIMTIAVIYTNLGADPDRYGLTNRHFSMLLILLISPFLFILFRRVKLLRSLPLQAIKWMRAGVSILLILVLIQLITGINNLFVLDSYTLRSIYGFYIGAIFSGVIGVGFYPILGSRVWCRFGCPMAALLGIQQKIFSKFRISVNGGQCISCGNCSVYCEMGIDVRSYAQKGQNIVRASCVGCGICAAVCPRGVLRLENIGSDLSDKTQELRVPHIQAPGNI